MTKEKLKHYKKILLEHKERIIKNGILSQKEDIKAATEESSEEGDIAASLIAQNVSFQLIEKEMYTLRAIDHALYRIEEGTYGQCDECGEDIGDKRLNFQPWADLCITHAEEMEKNKAKVG